MRRRFPQRTAISYLIVVMAAASPFFAFPLIGGFGFYDNQRLIEIFCVIVAAIFFSVRLIQDQHMPIRYDSATFKLMALFITLGFVSSTMAYAPRYAFFEWSNFLLLFALSYLIASEIAVKGDALLEHILRLCMLGCAAYIFVEIIIYVVAIKIGHQPQDTMLIFGFDNYRFFNHVQTTTLPLLVLTVYLSNNRKIKMLTLSVASLWWALLFVSAGRGTFMGLLVGLSVVWLCLRQDALPWCRIMLWSALIGLGIYFLFYVLIPLSLGLQPFGFLFSLFGRTIENPDSGRWPLWMRAYEMILKHPWFGMGPIHFAHFGRDVQNGAHPHNWILQIACEWGTPALFCLVTIVALGFKRLLMVRQYLAPSDVKNRLMLAAWLTTGVAILVDGLVSGLIVMPTSQLWIALYIGCAWGWVVSITPAQSDATKLGCSGTVRICGLVGILVTIYFLVNGLWPEIHNLPFYESQSLQKDLYPSSILRPRIWAGGYF